MSEEMSLMQQQVGVQLVSLLDLWRRPLADFKRIPHPTKYEQNVFLSKLNEMFAETHSWIERVLTLERQVENLGALVEGDRLWRLEHTKTRNSKKGEREEVDDDEKAAEQNSFASSLAGLKHIPSTKSVVFDLSHATSSISDEFEEEEEEGDDEREGPLGKLHSSSENDIRKKKKKNNNNNKLLLSPQPLTKNRQQEIKNEILYLQCEMERFLYQCQTRCDYLHGRIQEAVPQLEDIQDQKDRRNFEQFESFVKKFRKENGNLAELMQMYATEIFETRWGQDIFVDGDELKEKGNRSNQQSELGAKMESQQD